jgi:predicted glycosyltransferase
LITPSCIEKKTFRQYGAHEKTIHQYKGVDEVEYLTGENYQKYLELRDKAIEKDEWHLVLRPEESFASYMKDKDSKPYLEIIEETIKHYKNEIIVFPRYEKQREIILEKFDGQVTIPSDGFHFLDGQVTIPSDGFHFLDMLSKANVVITGGGTMARESALLGVPSITYFWRHLEPQAFIEEKGFPSYSTQTIPDTKKIIKKICSNPDQYWIDTGKKLALLEKPSDVLIPLLKKDKQLKQYF